MIGKSGHRPLASQPTVLHALRVQTSAYGQPLPIVYGQNRIPGKLIWYGDFLAIAHTSTQKLGGKGGGGGGQVTDTQYTYQVAVAIALCEGPIVGINNVWDTKGQLALVSTSEQFTVPAGGGNYTVAQSANFFRDHGVGRADSYSVIANDYGSDGLVTLSGTQQTPMKYVTTLTGGGQYTFNPATSVYGFHSADAGAAMTITYVYAVPNSNSNGQPMQVLALTLFTGAQGQAAWGYLSSKHPGQDLGYTRVAYIASSAMDLGTSGTLPNLSYEVTGFLPFGAGITDAEPSAIVTDFLTNSQYGMGWSSSLLGDFSQLKNYCVANGLLVSPVVEAQQTATDFLGQALDNANSAAVWSEGVLKIVPYGDTTAVGNGVTFIPNTAPIYDFTDADFIVTGKNEDPVAIAIGSAADTFNAIRIEFLNRATGYNPEIAEDKDDASIAVIGVRQANPQTAHMITSSAVAKKVANFKRKRAVEVRARYSFRVGLQYALLDPLDLVTITDANLGLQKQPVRITRITEDETGVLTMEAEEFPWGMATPTLYPHTDGAGFQPNAQADPGLVNAPILFEAPDRLSKSGNYEIWMGLSGVNLTNWGGCTVWVSADGTNYKAIGRIYGPARMGGYTASLGAWADPDQISISSIARSSNAVTVTLSSAAAPTGLITGALVSISGVTDSSFNGVFTIASVVTSTNFTYNQNGANSSSSGGLAQEVLAVDLTESGGSLSSGTQADADAYRTLCLISTSVPELISYQTATLTAPNKYQLTYLRRAIFGTVFNVHAPDNFLRLDDAVFVWQADPTLVGRTLYFKFTSFNKSGLMEQSLANAVAYSFSFTGMYNNKGFASNNATVDSVTGPSIRIYGPGGVGSSYTAWKPDGTSRSVAGQTISALFNGAALAYSTHYYVTYSFVRATHRAYFYYSDLIQAVGNGEMRVGDVTTVASGGTGGTSGGGGQFGGASGGGGRLSNALL